MIRSEQLLKEAREQDHTCEFCYYELFDDKAYPCSRCVCNQPTENLWRPKQSEDGNDYLRGYQDGFSARGVLDRAGVEIHIDKPRGFTLNADSGSAYKQMKDEPQTDYERGYQDGIRDEIDKHHVGR